VCRTTKNYLEDLQENMERENIYDFEPANEPAKSIYLAFQTETAKREGRVHAEWVEAERAAVYREAIKQAKRLGLRSPTIEEVADAERSSMGSKYYATNWSQQVASVMTPLATTVN